MNPTPPQSQPALMSEPRYKVTALSNGIAPDITETFMYLNFALKAIRMALKTYDSVKLEKVYDHPTTK